MRQTIITVLLLMLIAAGGWAWYKFSGEMTSGPSISPQELQAENERLQLYRKLNKLKPDIDILNNLVFQSLQSPVAANATTTIAKGRADPFAPL